MDADAGSKFHAGSQSDAIVVVGFGFNSDDSHINGLFRELIDSEQKQLYWVSRSTDGAATEQQRTLLKKLRIDPTRRNQVNVIPVDTATRCINGELWLNTIAQHLGA